MKPYRDIEINECNDPMVRIPRRLFKFYEPHRYVVAGAPYGKASPWMIRKSVLADLMLCKREITRLEKIGVLPKGCSLKIFDGYRPNSVQQYMIEFEGAEYAKRDGKDYAQLNEAEQQKYMDEAMEIFAEPSADLKKPPPHSSGGTLDLTLVDKNGKELYMGTKIDENSKRIVFDYFEFSKIKREREAHKNREILKTVMAAGHFYHNPNEWWHYDHEGTQRGVFAQKLLNPEFNLPARFGNAEYLPPRKGSPRKLAA